MTMMFDFLNKEAEENERNFVAPVVEYQVEAYQIVRVRKQTIGGNKTTRDILDTLKVTNGNPIPTKLKAVRKAKTIKDCFVIEKCERIIPMEIEEEEEQNEYED